MRKHLRRVVSLVVLAFVLVAAASAFARPGGGQSFGGGSKSSGGGSCSSGGSGFGGGGSRSSKNSNNNRGMSVGGLVLLIIVFGIVALVRAMSGPPGNGYSTGLARGPWVPPPPPPPRRPAGVPARTRLRGLESTDPHFSVIVFEDFAQALYVDVMLAAGNGRLEVFSPYLGEAAKRTLSARPLHGLTTALVGGMRIDEVEGLEPGSTHVTAHLVLDTNLSRRDPASGREEALYSVERWSLRRKKDAKSRAPDKARVLGCPSCSAPLEQVLAGRCKYCQNDVSTGAFDWVVVAIEVLENEARGPMLTGTTVEQGNEMPTVVDPRARARVDELSRKDPAFSYPGFVARVTHVFYTFQTAWSARDLASMRPYLSDALFATQTFWVSEYQRQRLRNVTENAAVRHVELARVTSDAYFDAITVRVYGSSLDYTLSDDTGQIVGGDRANPRLYTEYWTFVRAREAKGAARTDRTCPRCGAPLAINMAGKCTHCEAHVTSGSFDWVLSRIEQDEVYAG